MFSDKENMFKVWKFAKILNVEWICIYQIFYIVEIVFIIIADDFTSSH